MRLQRLLLLGKDFMAHLFEIERSGSTKRQEKVRENTMCQNWFVNILTHSLFAIFPLLFKMFEAFCIFEKYEYFLTFIQSALHIFKLKTSS